MNYEIYNELIKQIQVLLPSINLVYFLRPINLDSERKKFFRSKCTKSPQFIYKRPPPYNAGVDLNNIQIPNDDLGFLLSKKVARLRLIRKLLNSNNDVEFSEISQTLFGSPSKEYINLARNILNKNGRDKINDKIPFHKIVEKIEVKLSNFPVDVKLEIVDEESIINRISASTDKIIISKKFFADEDEIKDLLAHELETHIQRKINGSTHPFLLSKFGSADYLETEEGLANLMGLSWKNNKLMVHPALLYIAISTALKSDFITTFREMKRYVEDELSAWTYTVRAKRGLKDTSLVGAYTKDMYLEYAVNTGVRLIKNPKLLKTAFDGKGSLEELYKFRSESTFKSYLTINRIKKVLDANDILYP